MLALAQNAINRAVIDAGSSTSNINITVPGYSEAPVSAEIPFVVLLTPTATNVSPCTVTPSWGVTSYPIWDAKRKAVLAAGVLSSGYPGLFLFDGTKFLYLGSTGLIAGTDYIVPAAVVTTLPASGSALANNTEYVIAALVNTYEFAFPANPFHTQVLFTTGSSPNILFPAGAKYINKVPVFEASKTYELDIKNGRVACGEVLDA